MVTHRLRYHFVYGYSRSGAPHLLKMSMTTVELDQVFNIVLLCLKLCIEGWEPLNNGDSRSDRVDQKDIVSDSSMTSTTDWIAS